MTEQVDPRIKAILKAGEPETWVDSTVLEIAFGLGIHRQRVRTIVDVGANVGSITMGLHAFYPAATIYAFEPNPEGYARLRANLRREPFASAVREGRIRPYELGLSDTSGDAILHVLAHADSSSLIPVSDARRSVHPDLYQEVKTVRVGLTTLDSFAVEQSIDAIDILKVDVEGAYLEVLAGGKQILNHTQCVVLEVDFVTRDRSSRAWIESFEILHSAGLYLTAIYGVSGNRRHGLSVRDAIRASRTGRLPEPMRTYVIDCLLERL